MASLLDAISEDIVAAIETITVANGYANNIGTAGGGGGAQRFQQSGQTFAVLPSVLVAESGETKERGADGHAGGSYTCTATYEIDVISTTPTGASSSAAYVLGLIADVEKALRVDRNRGQGAAVIETRLNGSEPWFEPGQDGIAYVGATIRVTVVYRHSATDPGVGFPP